MQLSADNKVWLEAFLAKHGRAPRILHIGNIANNAYNNAKLLNDAGLDCDVICYDYYHIMGCPEWEDADFSGDYGDQFKPDWIAANPIDFKRPKWFAQGPVLDCIKYLIATRGGDASRAKQLWNKLSVINGTFRSEDASYSERIYYLFVRMHNYWYKLKRTLKRNFSSHDIASKDSFLPYLIHSYQGVFVQTRRLIPAWLWITVEKFFRTSLNLLKKFKLGISISNKYVIYQLDNRSNILIDEFDAEFPFRVDRLSRSDINLYASYANYWKDLFQDYDYVIGYSTDPVIPLVCGVPYFAFEHGTIRDIPYEKTPQGRLTSLAYRKSQHVFVTNFDCVPSAEFLSPRRFTVINHPYDEDHGLSVEGSKQARENLLKQLDCDFLLFHPTRQDWVAGTGYADKGNDVFMRAFGKLRNEGFRVGLVACAWGSNVRQSQYLLADLGCQTHVYWVPPLAITPFERMCKACDVVVDQFKLGAFGGVVFKAMAVGTPIITYLNESIVLRQYPELPPVINCKSSTDIELSVQQILEKPGRLTLLGKQTRDWIKQHHGKIETVNKQFDQFRLNIEEAGFTI